MTLSDAKIILNDILEKQVVDSLLNIYVLRDSLNTSTISLQLTEIKVLQEKGSNQAQLVANLEKIMLNKDKEITNLNQVIKKQKREIVKQKVLKIIGFTAAVVIPITIILLTN